MKFWLLTCIVWNLGTCAYAGKRDPNYWGYFSPETCASKLLTKKIHLPFRFPGETTEFVALQGDFEIALEFHRRLKKDERYLFELAESFGDIQSDFVEEFDAIALRDQEPSEPFRAAFAAHILAPGVNDPKKLARIRYYYGARAVTLPRFIQMGNTLRELRTLLEYQVYYLAVLREFSSERSINFHSDLKDKQITASNFALNELLEKSLGRSVGKRADDLAAKVANLPVVENAIPQTEVRPTSHDVNHMTPDLAAALVQAAKSVATYRPVTSRMLQIFVPPSLTISPVIYSAESYDPLPLAITHLLKFHLDFLSETKAPPTQLLRWVLSRALDLLVMP